MKSSFKEIFLSEGDDFLSKIKAELSSMDKYEVDDFGNYLYDEYVYDDALEYDVADDTEIGDDTEKYELIDIDEIMDIISDMDSEMLSMIYDDLTYEDEDITEKVTRKLHINKNRRKFMTKTRTDLRKEQTVRRRENRMSKQERRAYYKKNRANILAYSRDYYLKNKAGKHFKKIRKKT